MSGRSFVVVNAAGALRFRSRAQASALGFVFVLALSFLTPACQSTADAEEIVRRVNEELILSESAALPSTLPGRQPVGGERPDGEGGPDDLLARIDAFLERHPDRKAAANALRIRKAMLLLHRGQSEGARAAFEAFEPAVPGNQRDLALYQARQSLVFWWPVAAESAPGRLPSDAAFRERDLDLASVVEGLPRGDSTRLFLAMLRAQMGAKRAMNLDSEPASQVLIAGWKSLVAEVDDELAPALRALFSPPSAPATAGDPFAPLLQAIPETQVRFFLMFPGLQRLYERTWSRVREDSMTPPFAELLPIGALN